MKKRLPATALRLFASGLKASSHLGDPELSNDRYNAACAAVLAAAGRGDDAAELSADERAGLRAQALDWLRAELGFRVRAERAGRLQPAGTRKVLELWQRDADLAPVREVAELKKLPEAEQADWRTLWAEVALLKERLSPAVAPPPRRKPTP
jgi:hypothetical protein